MGDLSIEEQEGASAEVIPKKVFGSIQSGKPKENS